MPKLFAFNAFTGSSQGGASNAGCSDITPADTAYYASRTAKVTAAMIAGISGISYNIPWEAVEPVGPVGGVHTYDWTILDQALLDMAGYPGAQCLFRVIGGSGNGSPNWLLGGGSGRLLTDRSATHPTTFRICNSDGDGGISTSTGATTLNDTTKTWVNHQFQGLGMTVFSGASSGVVTDNTPTQLIIGGGWTGGTPAAGYYGFGTFPTLLQFDPTNGVALAAGTIKITVNGKPGPQETLTVSAYTPATGTVVTSTGGTNFHVTGTRVEWSKTPVAYTGGATYRQGDIVIAPSNAVIANYGPIGNTLWVCTAPIAVAPANFTTANALSTPSMCQSALFNDGNAMPVPWDPVLLANRQALIVAMGARYASSPAIYAVEMAGGGYLGEMGLRPGDTAQQTNSTWMPVGYTDRRFVDTWKTIISYYVTAFPSTGLIIDLDESFGQSQVWPTALNTGTFVTHGTATIDVGDTTGLALGMLVQELDASGHASTAHIPPNCYVGTIIDAFSFKLSSSQSAQVDVIAATSGGAGVPMEFNSVSRVVLCTTTLASASVLAAVTASDTSKTVSGTIGTWTIPAKTYVGDMISGGFKLSSSRTHQVDVLAGASTPLGGGPLTLAFDGEEYKNPPTGYPGVAVQEIAGQNSGGTLGGSNSDLYGVTPGNPPSITAVGWLGTTYPNRIGIQQNGLKTSDFAPPTHNPPLGRWRQLMAGAGGVNGTTIKNTLKLAHGGYQFGTVSATLAICQNGLQVAADDAVDGVEIYTGDVVAYPSLMSLFGSPLVVAPTVTAISPTSGPSVGSTPVTITGTQFTSTSTVKFGAVAATLVTFVSATSIIATSPAGSGTVDVTVTNVAGTSPTSAADLFTYTSVALPAITGVSPNNGPLAGGTTVTISGSGFTGVSAVLFGALPATSFTFVSDGSVTAVAPAATLAGAVDVRVVSSGTSPINPNDAYTYIAPPPPVTAIATTVTLEVSPPTLGSDYVLGGSLRVRATFRDQATSALVTPDSPIVFHVRQGVGVVIYSYNVNPQFNDPATSLVSLGVYDLLIPLTAAGKGAVRVITVGTRPANAVAQWQTFDPNF